MEAYYRQVLWLTGVTGILSCIPCIWLYRKDWERRRKTGIIPICTTSGNGLRNMALFLFIGAFLGQYGNMFVGLFQEYLNPGVYEETQSLISEGKSIWSLIFWMGIAAPFAEEVIFRWLVFLRMRDHMRVVCAAVLSGLAFGIYHMNLLQGVYATVLGTVFALLLEWSGNLYSSVWLHIGANTWSLVASQVYSYLLDRAGASAVVGINLVLVLLGSYGIRNCLKDYEKQNKTRKI